MGIHQQRNRGSYYDAQGGASCRLCRGWLGVLGLEPTPELFVAHIVEVCRALKRVLRDDGCFFLNLGDSFIATRGSQVADSKWRNVGNRAGMTCPPGLKPLDMAGIPWRVALALQSNGWYLRSDVIYHKQACMPESVSGWRWERCTVKVGTANIGLPATLEAGGLSRTTAALYQRGAGIRDGIWADCPGCPKCVPNGGLVLRKGSWRPTRSHEYIFMLTKSDSYFADGEAIREALLTPPHAPGAKAKRFDKPGTHSWEAERMGVVWGNLAGRNKRSVWTIAPEPFPGAHFAVFPEALVTPCVLASTPEAGVCAKCGAARARVVDTAYIPAGGRGQSEKTLTAAARQAGQAPGPPGYAYGRANKDVRTLGWRPTCPCNAPSRPAVVLDPFGGSGTVSVVARKLGRHSVYIDASEPYAKMAIKRLEEISLPLPWEQGSLEVPDG